MDSRRLFFLVLGLTALCRLVFSVWLPLTGDEAYFFQWGKYVADGYYDHPPMVGWILHVLLSLGDAPWILRLPSTILPIAIVFLGRALVRRLTGDAERADWAGMLLACVPVQVVAPLIATDVPLIAFNLAAFFLLERALRSGRIFDYALAGLAGSLAFLSKYFALLVPAAFLVATVFEPAGRSRRRRVGGILFAAVLGLQALKVNVFWNAQNCWGNYLFNAVNRHAGKGFSFSALGGFWLQQLYLATPFLVWALVRYRKELWAWLTRKAHAPSARWLAAYYAIPFVAFGISALTKPQSLQWMTGFLPGLVLLAGLALPLAALRSQTRLMGGFLVLHVAVISGLLLMPVETFKGRRSYSSLVLFLRAAEVGQALKAAAAPGARLATDGYTQAALMEHATGMPVAVLGEGSRYGRQDDWLTDFRQWQGADVVHLGRSSRDIGPLRPYFRDVRQERIRIEGASFYVTKARGFDYPRYRDKVLTRVRNKYYRIPSWLPMQGCPFFDKYGFN